jgi:gas vesicle protein
MDKEILFTITPNFSWLNLFESSIGSLVGALAGGVIALWIAKSQIKKGEEQFEKQMLHNENQFNKQIEHNNELRIKSDRVNLEIVKITKEYELEIQKLSENKNKLFMVIESLENFQDKILQYLYHISEDEYKDSLSKRVDFSTKLIIAFSTILQYTYSFAYKPLDIINDDEMGKLVSKIQELYELKDALDSYREKESKGQQTDVNPILLASEVVEKTRELLVIYIEHIEKVEMKIEELHDKFEEDIKREHENLMELHK